VQSAAAKADAEFSRRLVGIEVGSARYAVMVLTIGDLGLLTDLRRRHDQPQVQPDFLERLRHMPDEVDPRPPPGEVDNRPEASARFKRRSHPSAAVGGLAEANGSVGSVHRPSWRDEGCRTRLSDTPPAE